MLMYNNIIIGVEMNNIEDDITAETVDTKNCAGVFIRCTVKDESADSCVAVIHKKIVTSPYGLLNIKVQHLIDGEDGTVSGCVRNVTFDDHVIAVFSYSNSSGLIGRKAFTIAPNGMCT